MFDRGFTMHEHLSAFKLINMNGRMYDPVMSRFLSPDPIIQFPENSQSYNSYSYVLNNPLKFTDPSGFALDWFQNEITGDIYYNSTYKKGDEDKIEGEGWVHFAENGKLSEKSKSDFSILWNSKELWDSYIEFDKKTSYNAKGERVTSFNVEALFKGKNAKEFMNRQGYEKKPKQQIVYNLQFLKIPYAKRQPSVELRLTEKYTYLKKGNKEIGYNYIQPFKYDTKKGWMWEIVARSEVKYTDNMLFKKYLEAIERAFGGSKPIEKNISEYKFKPVVHLGQI